MPSFFSNRAWLGLAMTLLPVLPAIAQTTTRSSSRCGNNSPAPALLNRAAPAPQPGSPGSTPLKDIWTTFPYTDTDQLLTLPLVIHVVTDGSPAQQVSQAQIQSQIDVLNQDFNRGGLANPPSCGIPAFDALSADVRFQFCLAQVDYKTVSAGTTYSVNNLGPLLAVAPPIDQRRFINVWVCKFPGAGDGISNIPQIAPTVGLTGFDGAAVTLAAFGTMGTAQAPWNKGHVLTHELGHYFGLYHIWGDDGTACSGDDQISDTPNQGGPTDGAPAAGTKLFDACTPGGNGIMWMNYMDYTDDLSLTMFSQEQKQKMREVLFTYPNRSSLLGSNNTCPAALTCVFDPYETNQYGNSNNSMIQSTAITWNRSYLPFLCYQDQDWFSFFNNQTSPGGTIDLADPWFPNRSTTNNSGIYRMDVYKGQALVATDVAHYDVPAANGVGAVYSIRVYSPTNYHPFIPYQLLLAQPCAFADEAYQLITNPSATGRICGYEDYDNWGVLVTANSGKVQVSLTGLTQPYIITLFNENWQQVGTSNSNSNADKIITYDLPTPFVSDKYYYVRVTGYDGAFDPWATYTIAATLTPECTAEPMDYQSLTAAPATGQICPVGDTDHWLVKVPKGLGANSTTTITALLTGLTQDYHVELAKPNGNGWSTIATETVLPGSLDKQVSFPVPTPAVDTNYRLKVYGANGVYSPTGTYTLTASTAPNCPDPYEGPNGNNTSSTAWAVPATEATPLANLTNAQMCPQPSDVDWYKFTAGNLHHNVRLTMSNIPVGQDFDMELWYVLPRPQGLTLLATSAIANDANNTTETINYDPCFGKAYTYYVKVTAKNKGFSTGNYDLQVKLDGTYSKVCPTLPSPARAAGPDLLPFGSLPLQVLATPNPAEAAVELTLAGTEAEAPVAVELTDLLGRVVLRQPAQLLTEEGRLRLNVAEVPNGLYLVRVTVAGQQATTRLQIMR